MYSSKILLLYHALIFGGLKYTENFDNKYLLTFLVLCEFIGWGGSRVCIIFIFERNLEVIATIEFKRYMTYIGISGVIMGNLYH